MFAAQNDVELNAEQRVEMAMQVARDYIHNIRGWKQDSFSLRVKGQEDDDLYVLSAYKLEDKQKMQELKKSLPEGKLSGYYPSEFMMVVDVKAQIVKKDIRPFEKDQHQRP